MGLFPDELNGNPEPKKGQVRNQNYSILFDCDCLTVDPVGRFAMKVDVMRVSNL